MTVEMVLDVLREAFLRILAISGPALLVGMLVGLVISIFQATTQIQEQTLSFVPKLLAIFDLDLGGEFYAESLVEFYQNDFQDDCGNVRRKPDGADSSDGVDFLSNIGVCCPLSDLLTAKFSVTGKNRDRHGVDGPMSADGTCNSRAFPLYADGFRHQRSTVWDGDGLFEPAGLYRCGNCGPIDRLSSRLFDGASL